MMKVLYVEDNQQDADLARREMARQGANIQLEVVATLAAARQQLVDDHAYDVILLDLRLPDGSGLELLADIRHQDIPAVVIVLTGSGDEETAVAALKAGADDYLVKRNDYLLKLADTLTTAMARHRRQTARHIHPLNVLYVEHNPADIDLTRRHLAHYAPHIHLEIADSIEIALNRLPASSEEKAMFNVLLFDYRLPGLNALEALKIIHEERGLDIPVVLVTGQGNEDVAAAALRMGATDYMVKHDRYLFELPAVLENAFSQAQMKREQAALRESEARFRRLAENALDVIFRVRHKPTIKIEYISPAVTALTGYLPEDFYQDLSITEQLIDLETSFEDFFKMMARQAAEHQLITLPLRHKDGRQVWLEVSPVIVTNESGELIALEGIARDITERKKAEAERAELLATVQNQAQQIRQIVDAVPEGVLVVTGTGQIMLTNPVAVKDLSILVGRDWQEPLTQLGGMPLASLLAPPGDSGWHELTADGRTYHVIARPVKNAVDPALWVMVINDVTDLRAQQRYQQAQERLATVGQLAAGIAHDFNNVMGVIVLYAQLAQGMPELSAKTREHLVVIENQAHHAANLIIQILDFSRRSVLERVPMNLVNLVKSQVTLLKRTLPENIEIKLAFAQPEVKIRADPTRIQQVLMNLAINARDAMPDGGQLNFTLNTLSVSPTQTPPLPDMAAGGWAALIVSDQGVGIPPENLTHLFEPFFSTKEAGKGTGLGLAQVYGIVKQHDGSIDVNSRVGVGTTFTIYLPLSGRKAKEFRPDVKMTDLPGGSETILVVEDNPALRLSVVEILTELGYEVLSAANGRDAMSFLDPETGLLDLVLSDLIMPEMGGMEMHREVRRLQPQTKMVVMTGYTLQQSRDELEQEGITDWIQKPFTIDKLAQMVRKALDVSSE